MPTIVKQTCDRYDVRGDGTSEWAIILIAESGGIMAVLSDYGNYSYAWPYHGRTTFRHFLIELGKHTEYLMGKLATREYDPDATCTALLRDIIDRRKSGEITKAQARAATEAIPRYIDFSNEHQYFQDMAATEDLAAIYEDPEYIPCVHNFSAQIRGFVERLWPVFVQALREELKGERESSPTSVPAGVPQAPATTGV